jgi:hypothetical protein
VTQNLQGLFIVSPGRQRDEADPRGRQLTKGFHAARTVLRYWDESVSAGTRRESAEAEQPVCRTVSGRLSWGEPVGDNHESSIWLGQEGDACRLGSWGMTLPTPDPEKRCTFFHFTNGGPENCRKAGGVILGAVVWAVVYALCDGTAWFGCWLREIMGGTCESALMKVGKLC